jgi:enamine deaminase RidA (YjgF/YER057c/UK114 family)
MASTASVSAIKIQRFKSLMSSSSILGIGTLPASTWLGVQALALEGVLIEVDAIAVVES